MRERIFRVRRLLAFTWMGLLFACTPGASPLPLLPASTPRPICEGGRYHPTRFCLSLEGDPRPGHSFTLTFDAFYYAFPGEPPYTLTIILPDSLEILQVETSRPYRIQSNRLISLVDPAEMPDGGKIEGGAFTVTGTILTVDLGREGQQKLWEPYAGKEATGERVRMTVRLREPGEWQVRGILSQGESVVRAWLALLGWSTEAQAYWADHSTAFMRAWNLKSQQCGGVRPCTVRFPYDPYRFALGVPPEAPGHSLRERPPTFCSSYDRPGTCTDYGLPEVSPEDFQPEESPPPVSPPASSPPSPAAPARWLELSGRIHYRDPLTGALQPVRGVRVELWNQPEPSTPAPGG